MDVNLTVSPGLFHQMERERATGWGAGQQALVKQVEKDLLAPDYMARKQQMNRETDSRLQPQQQHEPVQSQATFP